MSTQSKDVSFAQRIDAVIQGVESTLPTSATLVVNQQSLTQAALLAALEAQAAPFDAVEAAQQQLKKLLAEREVATPAATTFYKQVASALLGYYGTDTASLADFGIAPRKQARALTAEQMVQKQAKAAMTRDMRGTKGSREKAGIKATGTFTVSVAAPSGTQSAPAPIPVAQPVAAQPVAIAAPLPAPVLAAPIAAPVATPVASGTATNGVATNGAVAPMLMNGSGH